MRGRRRLLAAFACTVFLAATLALAPRLRDRLPIALSSVSALRQGQHAFNVIDRLGETDGAWRAPRNLWQNASATTSQVCDRIVGSKEAVGCHDLGMNALALMGPRGWALTFLRGDVMMKPLMQYYQDGSSSSPTLPCGWTSSTTHTTLIFSFGHQSNIYHFYFLHLLPVFHIARILQVQPKPLQIFLLDTERQPPPAWALTLLQAVSEASDVILQGDVESPWCFRDAVIRNHNSWYLPSKVGRVDFSQFKLPKGLPVDEDMLSMAARIKIHFNVSMLTLRANARQSTKPPFVLYSSRDPPRYLKNRDKVVEHARRQHHAVSMVRFSGMTMKEQVRLVSESDVLVGVHGANLANLLYLDRGRSAAVLEIFPRLYPEEMPCELPQCETYNTFAAHVGIRYFRLFGVAHDDEDNSKGGIGNVRETGKVQRGKDLRRRTVVLEKDALAKALGRILQNQN